MANEVLTEGFGVLQPGETVSIRPKPGFGPVSGQVLAVDDEAITLNVPARAGYPAFVDRVLIANIANVERLGKSRLEPTIVRTYKGKNPEDASKSFRKDAERLAAAGYEPTSQSWAQGSWGCGAFLVALLLAVLIIGILIFIYLVVVKPDGTLTVTYSLKQAVPAAPPMAAAAAAEDTKVCPRCAETIKAAAVVCRFCGYEFGGPSASPQAVVPDQEPREPPLDS